MARAAFCFLILPVMLLLLVPLAQAGVVERLDRLDRELSAIENKSGEILRVQGELLKKIDILKIKARRT